MKKKNPAMLSKVINILLSVIQIIIGLFIALKLFNAKDVPFVNFINGLSEPLLSPFQNMFQPVTLGGRYILDLSALFALIVYSVIGYVLQKILGLLGLK